MLPKKLGRTGYTNSFFYGGELGFANMNTFLRQAGFNHISGIDDYPQELHTGKWGVADGAVLQHMLNKLDKHSSPFFSMLLTLSTHEPFDVPGERSSAVGNESNRFRKAARYTDRCLNEFFLEAKKKSWYPNTLFILVADHGHILPKRREYYDPLSHRIPLLFVGPGLDERYRGIQIKHIGGQHDLAATILELSGLQSNDLPYSNNLFDTIQPKPAYINYEAGFGWLEKDRQFVFLSDAGRVLPDYTYSDGSDSSAFLNRGKAYLQCLNNLFETY